MDLAKLADKVADLLVSFAPKVLAAVLVILAFRLVYRVTRGPLVRLCTRFQLEAPLIKLLVDTIYRILLLTLGGVMAAGQLGIDVLALLAGLGVAGIAVGFAAQDSLSNIIAGLIIFLDKPFTVGDWVRIGDRVGKVFDITMRSTRIQTEQNTYLIIPNKTIIDQMVDNFSKYGHLRIDVPVSIAYSASIQRAREVLVRAVSALPGVLADPPVEVVVDDLAASGVVLQIEAWVGNAEQGESVRDAMRETAKLTLDEAGIEMPFPHLQLHIDDLKPAVVERLKQLR